MNTFADTIGAQLIVNKAARRNRHLRCFSKAMLVKIHFVDFLSFTTKPLRSLWHTAPVAKAREFTSSILSFISEIIPTSPQKKLLFQGSILSMAVVFGTSFSGAATFTEGAFDYSTDYIDSYSLPGDILVSDDEGYLVKINPQTADSNRIGLTDYAVHTVESGETLSSIAEKYGVKTSTVLWENGLSNANSLRTGQKLLVPPVDGVSYTVQKGDSIEKIATKYKITADAIVAQNNIADNTITRGQSLFLPGAVPIVSPSIASRSASGTRSVRVDAYDYSNVSDSDAAPSIGKIFIYPTTGKITQGYRAGHYATDIADRSKPAIWAAADGTVEKVSTGTWGGGYGNHIIIDHGDGVKTLYAHMASVDVEVGDTVSQGDVIGIMGNTGRVYGATGIHLHFEVMINGVKKNPVNYF
ncbi:MAG: M23 family metallopeptidase [Candidatus Gracilibacteria bacterium]|jgi:murein DD-endopeptidase MepM/ murein hydrolase activator NlpD